MNISYPKIGLLALVITAYIPNSWGTEDVILQCKMQRNDGLCPLNHCITERFFLINEKSKKVFDSGGGNNSKITCPIELWSSESIRFTHSSNTDSEQNAPLEVSREEVFSISRYSGDIQIFTRYKYASSGLKLSEKEKLEWEQKMIEKNGIFFGGFVDTSEQGICSVTKKAF
ncbi:MAG: hypothetical protein PXX73_03300 [Sideroxydans sp.]|nr:hypothetical protein [Sideroxydans sp.]